MITNLISRNNSDAHYQVWRFNPSNPEAFEPVSISEDAEYNPNLKLAPIGGYVLEWGPGTEAVNGKNYSYKLFEFDPNSSNPLNGKAIQQGIWSSKKFWSYRSHYSDNPTEQNELPLISMGNFMLFFVGGKGRGTYMLYNFDPNLEKPNTSDPLPSTYTPQGGFPSIQEGHELICINNYVIDRHGDGSNVRIWSFDPQNTVPLSIPEVWGGNWCGIDSRHQIVPIGDKILTWIPGESDYTLWSFSPGSKDPFEEIGCGKLPDALKNSSSLLAIHSRTQQVAADPLPGTMDYMRSKIKHVVYYMLESRSFDNVCGWLYEKDQSSINFIGSDKPFEGANSQNFNLDGDKKAYQSKFHDGQLSDQWDLSDQKQDPFHDNSDGLQQMFFNKYPGYPGKVTPDMGGFVVNNSSDDVMLTLCPDQLPILNGLAANFAISDEWFCSVPGGTDINRSFAHTGSAMNRLDTWEGGTIYQNWNQYPHRQSLWKVLWNNGIKDWKLYNAIEWTNHPFSYHLYLEGQVPSVDANKSQYLDSVDNFLAQAKVGTLPSFSFLEPVWIAPVGTSSYHPGPGASMVPAEVTLNTIYEAIKSGPHWEDTLLVVTFSKNGGIYDHVIPPYAAKPWPNDWVDGFEFDLLGPRVPAIMVSPWIKKNTVIRSGGEIPFDSTSFAATLLNWYGIPKSRWGMGDRMDQAPTFEGVFQEAEVRTDRPSFSPPYDKGYPKK